MGELSPWHWAVVILVLVLLFGAKRLPEAARGIGRSARILKAELHPEPEDAAKAPPAAEPQAAVPAAAAEHPASPATADPLITTSPTPPRHD